MPVVIPVFPGEPLYQERIRLEGRDFILRFDWANRESRYYLSIFDQDESPLLLGVKVIANWGLLAKQHHNADLPPGELVAVDLESGGVAPSLDDFGIRVRLFYYESTEDLTEFAS